MIDRQTDVEDSFLLRARDKAEVNLEQFAVEGARRDTGFRR